VSKRDSTRKKAVAAYRKPRADVYTMLLIIAFLALIAGIACLWGELSMYEWKHSGGPSVSSVMSPATSGGLAMLDPRDSDNAVALAAHDSC
jgi:hypothetical protein